MVHIEKIESLEPVRRDRGDRLGAGKSGDGDNDASRKGRLLPAGIKKELERMFAHRESGEPKCDVIAGGFPCQDISTAGKGEGINGEQSSLWFEMLKTIRLVGSRYIIVENVAAITYRGLGEVLRGLAESGYDAEWFAIRASDVGALHKRERIFIIAYPNENRESIMSINEKEGCGKLGKEVMANATSERLGRGCKDGTRFKAGMYRQGIEQNENVAYANNRFCEYEKEALQTGGITSNGSRPIMAYSSKRSKRSPEDGKIKGEGRSGTIGRCGIVERVGEYWAVEPDVGRVAYGVPNRVDRIKALGNAVVPQVAEFIGRRIIDAERE